jgi:carboxyl-terminal processing protease
MNRWVKIVAVIIVLIVVVFASLGAGIFIGSNGFGVLAGSASNRDEPEEFGIFWQAWNTVQENFVDQTALDAQVMTYGAIRGMVQALGDEGHTSFLTPEERERQETELAGTFSGIGATLGVRDQLPVIVAPFDGSPADQAGVKAGDIILQVDGEDVTSLPLNEIVALIRGEEGTEVTLSLLRPDETRSLEVTITRGEIKVPAASWAMIPDTSVALIRLSQFTANAQTDVVSSLVAAEEAGATALIVDVRNNPGGLLTQAVGVTSQFLTEGNVLLEEDADGNRTAYAVEEGGVGTELPVLVLINSGSASSSEIFAGALQDYDRAELVGQTTFGTGTVLQPYTLGDGSVLLLGTRQWLTPEGRLIRKQGIAPDYEVELPIEADLLTPEEIEELEPSEILASDDTQLLKALELFDVPWVEEVPVEEEVPLAEEE